MYQIENHLYDDSNSGKRELFEDVHNWNWRFSQYQRAKEGPWTGWFLPDIYGDLSPIDYKLIK